MAQAAIMNVADIPLIEEHVDTGLQPMLDAYKSSYIPGGDVVDEMMGRFTLYPSRPLPDFDNMYAKAYEAHDNFNDLRLVYAMVCDDNMPTRNQAITEMTSFVHPHLATLLGVGTVRCSHLGESRTVMFIERPRGLRLSEIIKTQQRLHEHRVIDNVLQPAIKALQAMRERKTTHGHIHLNNFFIGDVQILGECYSAPCSTQTPFVYEPLERLMADTLGRGEATEKSDVYALAVMAFELIYGLEKIRIIPRDVLIQRLISNGSYATFAIGRDFSDTFQDFFRGIFNENPAERWGIDQLVQWVNGKRFNMIALNIPKEASRPLVFLNEDFFNRRMLAHSLHSHWREALKDIKGLKLDRWCEMSLHRPELAEKMDRSLRFSGNASTDAQMRDTLTRVIILLDPTGPMRSQGLSLRPDAIGVMLADVMRHNSPDLPQLLSFIENDISNFWIDQIDGNKTTEISALIWRLQRVRPYLKMNMMGFGLERVFYDLNPSIACQMDLLKPYHITTALEALKTLDALALKLSANSNFSDRHLAAFIASKIDITKEVRLRDFDSIPSLANNKELVVLKILAKAQQKNHRLQLPGLCIWAAMRIEGMIDEIHNRVIRKRLKLQLKKLAATGYLNEVLTAIINPDVSFRDHEGFAKAIALHKFTYERIETLKNEAILEYKARRSGGKMAMIISYAVMVIVCYITISDMYGI